MQAVVAIEYVTLDALLAHPDPLSLLRPVDALLSTFPSVELTAELATRFLADYIVGDKYFKIKEPEHNLIRTRCQIALAKDMLRKMDAMNAIVQDCAKRYKAK